MPEIHFLVSTVIKIPNHQTELYLKNHHSKLIKIYKFLFKFKHQTDFEIIFYLIF